MLDIGKVTEKTGINASALRFYESKGLIKPAGRKGLRRYYADNIIEQLSIIALGQTAGFTLDEIASFFSGKSIEIDRDMLLQKSKDIALKISRLQAIEAELIKVANCPNSNHFDCHNFNKLLNNSFNTTKTFNKF
ncbi:MerR family transcriptional regulator [Pseudoalteromonas luteoviolacea]|uniref:MerR family transcriptional regulator n=1 Tax=Pseudoalteromonas luteoviolacea TaxID=43657 RepID=UPI001EEEA827|nr:MerR family transcriptional regulator [Pseudoalteromonas luteoviolacea]MCF6442573.1 MerR family transcriptional regulator [Pseudoalteromonas luteoviolacea]